MNADTLFWISLGALLVTSLAAIGARSLREFSRHDLEELCRKHRSDLKFSEILRYDEQVAVAIESLHVATTALFVATAVMWTSNRWTDWSVRWVSVLVVAIALLMCKIWMPRAVARIWATPILFHTWRLWRVTGQILVPLVLVAQTIDTILHRLAGRTRKEPSEELFEDEIRTIVSEGHREGLLEEEAREMIEGVIELGAADVAKAMTPRTDMVMMPVRLAWTEMIDFVAKAGHARIPVFDKSRDDIVGILHVKDLLPLTADGRQRPAITEILRTPYFVPETKRLDHLLAEFQKTRNHTAIVLDEYGGVSGLVTIEDVLEEVVGEIVDEYAEAADDEFKQIDGQTAEASARIHLDELNERLGISLPDDGDYDTLGGFVFSQLGHVPTVGERVDWEGVSFEVLEASRRRAERLRITMPEPRRETA